MTTTTFSQIFSRRLGTAYLSGLRDAAALLVAEARKHDEALADIEDENCEEALLHSVESESLRALADRINTLPNPYYGAGRSDD